MRKMCKLLAVCFALMVLIVCMAFAGCKKTPDTETDGDTTTTTTEQMAGDTTEIQVGEEGFMPDDDDVVVQIEGTKSSSSVGTSKSSGTASSTKASSSNDTTKSSSKTSDGTTESTSKVSAPGTTKDRAPGETPIY